MHIYHRVLYAALIAASPSVASAMDGNNDFFAGIEILGGFSAGSSSTTNGGGNPPLFNGEGIVKDVTFGANVGLGGHVGYRFDPNWSVFASYSHIRSGVGWNADYPLAGVASSFAGDAFSNVLMGNVAYTHILSDETSLIVKAGLGASFNTLAGIIETDQPSGLFVSQLADNTTVSLAGQIGLGIRQKLASNISLGLDASLSYAGSFKTGDTRTGNMGVTAINPYALDDVWRGNLGASLKVAF